LQVLVVGGEHAFVQGTLAEKFRAIGITIGEHWDWSVRRPPNKAQGNCAGVVVLHDMVGHHLSNAAKEAAAKANIPFVLIPRKFSAALPVLERAGLVKPIVVEAPAPEPVTPVEVVAPVETPTTASEELIEWTGMVLENNFAATDEALVAEVLPYAAGLPIPLVKAEITRARANMRQQWQSYRPIDQCKSLEGAVANWFRSTNMNLEDSGTLSRVRKDSQKVFGVRVPEDFLFKLGFQSWELRGAFTRERVRLGVRNGDQMLLAMSEVERAQFAEWVESVGTTPSGKPCSPCPVNLPLNGQPLEGVSVILRVSPNLRRNEASRVYINITKSGLGPNYLQAIQWAHQVMPPLNVAPVVAPIPPVAVPVPVAVPTPPVAVPTTPVAVYTVPRCVQVLFGEVSLDDLNSDQYIRLAGAFKTAYDAVQQSARSLAAGGNTGIVDTLVREEAANILAQRELAEIEASRTAAYEAVQAAQEAFLQAQENFNNLLKKATEVESRISALRG
jgi:hypothetical protein